MKLADMARSVNDRGHKTFILRILMRKQDDKMMVISTIKGNCKLRRDVLISRVQMNQREENDT